MVRWIAFDDESAEAVVSRYRRGAAEIQHGDPVAAALTLGRSSRLLLPSTAPGRVIVACFEPRTTAPLVVAPADPAKPGSPAEPRGGKWWQSRSA